MSRYIRVVTKRRVELGASELVKPTDTARLISGTVLASTDLEIEWWELPTPEPEPLPREPLNENEVAYAGPR